MTHNPLNMNARLDGGGPARFHPFIHPMALHEGLDVNGSTITVGALVRSFDFPLMTGEGTIIGMDTEGEHAAFVEGVVEQIGVFLDGCPRYKIRATRQVYRDGTVWTDVLDQARFVYPPVNGTPSLMGGYTFGVVAR